MSNADWNLGYEAGFKVGLKKDDPMLDGTDFAHPAWHRGNERAFLTAIHEVNDILDGTASNVGISIEPWQSLRQRLYDIRTLLGIAERIVGQVEYGHNSKFYLNISQWYKVRRDYARRVQGIRATKLAKEKQ
jgi:hypothetical protein